MLGLKFDYNGCKRGVSTKHGYSSCHKWRIAIRPRRSNGARPLATIELGPVARGRGIRPPHRETAPLERNGSARRRTNRDCTVRGRGLTAFLGVILLHG